MTHKSNITSATSPYFVTALPSKTHGENWHIFTEIMAKLKRAPLFGPPSICECVGNVVHAEMICQLLPSPLEMSSDRVEKLLCTRNHSFAMMPPATQQLKHGTVL